MRGIQLIATLLVFGLPAVVPDARAQCPGFGDCCINTMSSPPTIEAEPPSPAGIKAA